MQVRERGGGDGVTGTVVTVVPVCGLLVAGIGGLGGCGPFLGDKMIAKRSDPKTRTVVIVPKKRASFSDLFGELPVRELTNSMIVNTLPTKPTIMARMLNAFGIKLVKSTSFSW